jgi:acetylornithine deacetylase/succinyl-diaminopimelate desuccinylase-like protein
MRRWAEEEVRHLPGARVEVLRLPKRTPVLMVDVPGSVNDCVLMYGHLDKQPEFSGWSDGLEPWTPVLRDGKLYGRGGADDGYALFASVTAIRALREQGLPHARCVVLIEASEESGSPDLAHTSTRWAAASARRPWSSAWMPSAATTSSCGARPRCAAT